MVNEVLWTEDGQVDFARVQQNLRDDGYVVVRNLIPPPEAARLRSIVETHLARKGARYQLGKTQPNAAAHVPDLAFIFQHPRILALFREAFGENAVVFTRHCDIHRNMVSGWHKDSGESVKGGYFRGDYFAADDCQVYKVALYLQDTTPHSGLTIEPGSHRRSRITGAPKLNLVSQTGDAILFDVRLSHTGQLPDKIERGMQLLSAVVNGGHRKKEDLTVITWLHDMYWRLLGREDRMSAFFTFGVANEFTRDFAEANLRRQAQQLGETVESEMGNVRRLAAELSKHGVLTHGVNFGEQDRVNEPMQ